MANYANIKATIDANIYANGNEEITGPVLNSVLTQMIDTFKANGFLYKGIAIKTSNPGTPDANVFYLAQGPGTFTNFGGLTLPTGDLYVLRYNGSWSSFNLQASSKATPLDLTLLAANVEPYYINSSTDRWASSANYTMFFIPIVAGLTYRVTAPSSNSTIFAILRDFPREPGSGSSAKYATGESFHTVSAGTFLTVTAPSNGYYMAVSAMWGGVDRTPADISVLTTWDDGNNDAPSHPRFITPVFSSARRVDCRTAEATFGKIASTTSTSWGVTQAFPVKGARWVRFFTGLLSTSSGFYDYSGACFYDKNMVPLTSGVWTIGKSSTAYTGWVDLDVPSGAEYLVYTFTLGSSQTGNKMEIHYLDEDDVDTTSGAMSCPSTYWGKRISLRDNRYGVTLWGGDNITHQSAARFGKYLFCVAEYVATVNLYDLEARKTLYTLTTGITQKSWWHCNQCCFTDTYYDAADDFPLLYVSMQNNGDGRGECVAFRIVPTWTDGEISSFTFTQVQSILLPAMSDDNCLGNANFAYDPHYKCFWVYSRNNNSSAANYRKAKYSQVAVPALWNGATLITDVSLTDADIITSFADDYSMLNAQGGFIQNGRLYFGQGKPGDDSVCLRVIDLYGIKKMESYIDLSAGGFTFEPEGTFEYQGELMMTVYGSSIARVMI